MAATAGVDAPATGDRAHPTVLFDGVCNLCNASVRWLIERDRREVFRLASLQSGAAGALLGERLTPDEIEALPDAIVLVDERGVHAESTAALRIAARLGPPWKALALLLVVPRPLRDAAYRFVARNRYRWFGHRDVCAIPSPEAAHRFLDAGEAPSAAPVSDPRERAEPTRSWARAWAVRFAIAYLMLYLAPFPLNMPAIFARLPLLSAIPGLGAATGWLAGFWDSLTAPLVTLTGSIAFGVDVEPRMTGSGDQTFNHLELVFDLVSALVVSIAWTAWVRARHLSETTLDVTRVLARYYLGTFLLLYGWVKVFPLQMPAPGPDRLMMPFGDTSPMGLAWTFIGASAGYQIFSGLCELLAGYLLLWRRTALAGALVAMAVMLNVMAINYFYDVPVKLFSTHLFLFALFVATPDLPRLVGMLGFNLPVAPDATVPFWKRLGWSGRAVALANLAFVGVITGFHVTDNREMARTRGFLAEPSPLTGTYVVERFEQDGVVGGENPDSVRWVRVGITMPSLATIQRANGVPTRGLARIDLAAETASFYAFGEAPPEMYQFRLERPEEGVLHLRGTYEGKPTVVTLRRTEGRGLLVERGFHWINEIPLNR